MEWESRHFIGDNMDFVEVLSIFPFYLVVVIIKLFLDI